MATDNEDREIWKNDSQSVIGVNVYGMRGAVDQRQVMPGHSIRMTTEERKLLNIAADAELDPFRNGLLMPITLADTVEDLQDIQANKNVMSESEMKELVTGHWKTLATALEEISAPHVLKRLRTVAIAEDVGVKTLSRIDERIEELHVVPEEGHYKAKVFSEEPNPVAV